MSLRLCIQRNPEPGLDEPSPANEIRRRRIQSTGEDPGLLAGSPRTERRIFNMPNKLFTLALGGVFALGTTAALAQDTSAMPNQMSPAQEQGKQLAGKKKNMDADQQLQRLTRRLDLSSTQQSQIKPILEDRQQKMQALHQDESISQTDKRTQAKSIRDDTNGKIEAVLNDNQKQKFEAMQEKKSEKKRGITATPETSPSTTPPTSPQPPQ
jgi:periplasmic protein CpxP/Spy